MCSAEFRTGDSRAASRILFFVMCYQQGMYCICKLRLLFGAFLFTFLNLLYGDHLHRSVLMSTRPAKGCWSHAQTTNLQVIKKYIHEMSVVQKKKIMSHLLKEMEHWKISPPAEPKESKHKHRFFFLTSLHLLSAVALAQRKLMAGRGTGRVRGRCSVEQTVDRRPPPKPAGKSAAPTGQPPHPP